MKPTAKNIAKYVNEQLDKPRYDRDGKQMPYLGNISISLPRLPKITLEALRNN